MYLLNIASYQKQVNIIIHMLYNIVIQFFLKQIWATHEKVQISYNNQARVLWHTSANILYFLSKHDYVGTDSEPTVTVSAVVIGHWQYRCKQINTSLSHFTGNVITQ